MKWNAQNLYSVDLSNGETERDLLTALAIAGFLLADPMGDPGDDGTISLAEARKYVSDHGVTMLFVKGRLCMTHIKVVSSGEDRVLLKFEMYEGSVERLMLLARDALDRLVPQHMEIEVDIDMSEFDHEVGTIIEPLHTLQPLSAASA